MGHMNVMWYVGKFDEAIWNVFARVGLSPRYLRENGRGMAAVEQRIRYHHEMLAGDVVAIESRLIDIRDKAVIIEQTLLDADRGRVAATMQVTAVHLDTLLRRAVPFPEHVAQRIREQLEPAPTGQRHPGLD
jgi:acyl-CoA thioester hydrolase